MRSTFAKLEEDIAYFKAKREVIVFDDMNARTRNLQLDAQQIFMPQMYSHSIDEKGPNHFGKLLLEMCNSTEMLIANGVLPNTNGFTRKNKVEFV